MSLWLKMSFCKEKQSWEIWMLIYIKTLGESDWSVGVLAKVSQLGWWGTPISSSSSLLVKLGMIHMVNYGGSWMKTILKDTWVFRMVTIRLFLQTFWEKSFKTSQIIARSCSQLSKLILSCFHRSQYTFCCAILGWTYVSRTIRIHLVISTAIRTLEDVLTQFAFFCFKTW